MGRAQSPVAVDLGDVAVRIRCAAELLSEVATTRNTRNKGGGYH